MKGKENVPRLGIGEKKTTQIRNHRRGHMLQKNLCEEF
jgi:hypothetical protein